MSLQDSNVVRTAAELEKKYNFRKLLGLGKNLETVSGQIIKVENELNNMLNSLIINLGDVLDSQTDISLWFYPSIPTTLNEPYISWITNNTHGVPNEYTEVEYIESSGTQYIDTGYKPTINPTMLKVDTKFYINSGNTSDNTVLGGRTGTGNGTGYKLPNICDNIYELQAISGASLFSNLNVQYNTPIRFEADIKSGNTVYSITDSNGLHIGTDNTTGTSNSGGNLYLMAMNQNGAKWFFHGRIYYLKLWDNNVLVRNMIPCVRKSDNKPGMYDTVNDVFYTNLGSGDFSYPNIIYPDPSEHIGDLYYAQDYGYVYKYTSNGWTIQTDLNLINALALTNAELDVSQDHERKIYFTQPIPPYSSGDWWILEDGTLKICQLGKSSGYYETNDFIVSSQYVATIATKQENTITVLKGTVQEITEDYVKFTDLSTGGSTTIAGENVSTGTIKSNNYAPASGSTPTQGTAINLSNGTIDSKNFKLDNQGNIDVQGYITSGKGILTNLQFTGLCNDWNAEGMADNRTEFFLGFNQTFSMQTYTMKNRCNFFCAGVYIPENFIVESANIVINHNPVMWSGNRGYCRKVKAYNVSNYMGKNISTAYNSEIQTYPNIVFNSSNEISSAFGANGKTFNSTSNEVFASNDISSIFKNNGNTVSGNYYIAVKPTDAVPAYAEGQNPNQALGVYTGYISMMVNIIGYMKTN